MKRTFESRFYPELEGLRGVASLSVLVGHCYLNSFPTENYLGSDLSLLHRFIAGVFDPQPAVLLFFVLSGFVLSCQLDRAPVRSASDYGGYMVRRLFRLMPAVWVSLLLALAVTSGHEHAQLRQFLGGALLWDFTLNIVIWTMLIEVVGSLVLPAMTLVAGHLGVLPNAALFAALLVACRFATWPLALPFQVFFFAGVLIAYVPHWFVSGTKGCVGVLVGIAAVTIYFWAPVFAAGAARAWHYASWNDWMWLEVPACVLIVYFVAERRFRCVTTLLNTCTVRFLGRISFSLYLLHYPLLVAVSTVFGQHGLGLNVPLPFGTRLLIFGAMTAVVIALSVPVAALCFALVEKPGIALGRALAARMKTGKGCA